jgi:signal transduction histidine kinase/DNA-binding response OmpR family regulator
MSEEKRLAEQIRDNCLAGGGEMGRLMRSHDWAATPFGQVSTWPQSLRTAISLMLASRFAMVIAWGPDFRFFYNDRYRPVLGASKHPGALGTPAREIFPEAWPQIGPLFESTRDGESVGMDDLLIPLDRYGYLENCYFTLSYSPIRDESGGVGGMLAVVAETTERVQGERRLKTLRDLARRAADAKTAQEACVNAAHTLGENSLDVPFALLYLLDRDGKIARLESACGLAPGMAASPAVVDLAGAEANDWPLSSAIADASVHVLDDLPQRFGPLPGGPYEEPTHGAVLVPLLRPGQRHPDGILVFGVSPRRALDDQYRAFFELAADHILTAIRNALAYQEERERAERLAELDRAKTLFFSNISHEFRTPLTLMLGPLEDTLAKDDHRLPPEDREQLSLVHRNSLRLLKLVNTLLDFSRIESGRIEAVYEPVDLATYTAELASVFRSAVERAGLNLMVDCPPLPEPVYVDREMWEKIVLNLISNAFKFTFEGDIVVRLSRAGDRVELEVRDTGTGIPEEELANLFKRFHRVRGARARTDEGSGIGLALVQELVRLHGGTIRVASTLDMGTTLTVAIPTGHQHLAADRIKAEPGMAAPATSARPFAEEALRWLPESDAGTRRRGVAEKEEFDSTEMPTATSEVISPHPHAAMSSRPVILLADDNADMREYVRRLLAPSYQVEVAADGAMALAAARQQAPDLILSDVMMPRLDGFELLQELRADPKTKNIPVILLSARAGEESRVEGLRAGADDYLVKPFSARELLARIKTHIDLNLMRQEARKERRIALEAARENAEILETINTVGQLLTSELDLHKLVQAVTDAATELTGAQFGSFFYNVLDSRGESYMLYTLSGVPREAFAHFPMPRATDLFGPTFRGEGVVRIDDVKLDPRHARNDPYYGMPEGHLPVVSYLAVPVVSRSGEVLGGLFFGHPEPGVFTERDEKVVNGLAGQAAIAIDNARLFEAIKKERAQETFLAQASEALAESLDYETTLKNLARVAVNHLADWCVIDVVDEKGGLRRVASAHNNPAKEKLLVELQDKFPPDWDSPQPAARVLRTGKSELLRELTDDLMAERVRDAQHMKLLKEIGIKSHMAVVLSARGNRLGAISLGLSEGAGRYGPDDLSLAEELGRRAAFAIDNARLYRLAQEANHMKDEFLATVSHELRTPLNAVLGWARMLRSSNLDAETAGRALETIERNARSQAQLIDDLLDVSRIISGKLRLDVRPVEIVKVIEASIDAVRPAAEAKNIRLQPILDRVGDIVLGDATRLQQVVWNLLSNAIKFTPKGGRVQISLSRVNSHLEIVVSDTGQGISRQFLPYVFDRFRQADSSSTRHHSGLGLGLAIVKHLVEMHGGEVRADSIGEGKGAIFTVSLPVSIRHHRKPGAKGDDANLGSLGETEASLGASPLAGLRILIVDDEADARDFLSAMLGQGGADVKAASSAAEVLDLLAAAPPEELPDVLVSDIGMPIEDGYALIRQVRSLPPAQGGQTKAIALTAYARFEDRMRALASGFQMHVAKPVEPAELTMVILSLMGRPANSRKPS